MALMFSDDSQFGYHLFHLGVLLQIEIIRICDSCTIWYSQHKENDLLDQNIFARVIKDGIRTSNNIRIIFSATCVFACVRMAHHNNCRVLTKGNYKICLQVHFTSSWESDREGAQILTAWDNSNTPSYSTLTERFRNTDGVICFRDSRKVVTTCSMIHSMNFKVQYFESFVVMVVQITGEM